MLIISSRRTPFTESDVTNLTKYLAVYSVGVDGRMGNKIYQDLVENVGGIFFAKMNILTANIILLQVEGRWPWSGRHPWSSWRDHYKRNSEMYDRKIKQYQQEKGITKKYMQEKPRLPTQHPNADNVSDTAKRKASNRSDSLPNAKRVKHSPQPMLPEKGVKLNGNRQRGDKTNVQPADAASETEPEDDLPSNPNAVPQKRENDVEVKKEQEDEVANRLLQGSSLSSDGATDIGKTSESNGR